jgi:hypothetical protein
MTPVLIYSLPRAKGTISLNLCKRQHHINEPFNIAARTFGKIDCDLYPLEAAEMCYTSAEWVTQVIAMNSSDSCVKIHPEHLRNYENGRVWYTTVIEQRSHDIYVVERHDRLNQFLSWLIARQHGWTRGSETNHKTFTVRRDSILSFRNHLDDYLQYYPAYGTIVSAESLPDTVFNPISSYPDTQQQSASRHSCINNLDFCVELINDMIAEYKDAWDSKIVGLSHNWLVDDAKQCSYNKYY